MIVIAKNRFYRVLSIFTNFKTRTRTMQIKRLEYLESLKFHNHTQGDDSLVTFLSDLSSFKDL